MARVIVAVIGSSKIRAKDISQGQAVEEKLLARQFLTTTESLQKESKAWLNIKAIKVGFRKAQNGILAFAIPGQFSITQLSQSTHPKLKRLAILSNFD